MTRLLILGGSDAGISAAQFHGMRVDDLNDLDLCYPPPRSLPWAPAQMSAQSWLQAATAFARG
jgi:hypothetical protein